MLNPDRTPYRPRATVAHLVRRALVAAGLAALTLATVLVLSAGLRVRVAAWLAATPAASATERTGVDHAIDGDTLITADGRTVRVLGLDAPETHHPDMDGPQPFGPEAAARLAVLVDGHTVRLERDATDVDGYGRLLRHVWVDDRLVAETLTAEGLAHVLIIPPNGRYADRLRAAEAQARTAGQGLWGAPRPTAVAAFATSAVALALVPPESLVPLDHGSSPPLSTRLRPVPATPPAVSPSNPLSAVAAPAIDLTQPCGARVAGAIPSESAGDFLDTFQAVEFTVIRTKDTGKVTFLNSHDPFQGHFYAAIFPTDYAAFPAPPEQYFLGKCIVVQGRIEVYRGAPQIVVRGAEDVRIVEVGGR